MGAVRVQGEVGAEGGEDRAVRVVHPGGVQRDGGGGDAPGKGGEAALLHHTGNAAVVQGQNRPAQAQRQRQQTAKNRDSTAQHAQHLPSGPGTGPFCFFNNYKIYYNFLQEKYKVKQNFSHYDDLRRAKQDIFHKSAGIGDEIV